MRQEKVRQFFLANNIPPRWCTAKVCGCMGCVNKMGLAKKQWNELFPNEPHLTKEDIENYNLNHDNK